MASIQLRNGSYRVMWRDGGRQRSLSFATKKAALAYRAQVEHGLLTGLQVDPHAAAVPLRAFVEQYLDGLTVKPKTAYNYRSVWAMLDDELGDRMVNTLTRTDCQRALASLAHSHGTAARTVLKHSLQVAVDSRVLFDNPAEGLRVAPQGPRPVSPFTALELRRVAEFCGPYETFVLFQGLMGTRFGEAAALTPQSVRGGVVTIDRAMVDVAGTRSIGSTKTGQVRSLPIPAALLRLMERDGCFERQHLFETVRGRQLRNNNFRTSYWLPALTASGLQTRRIHDLRHTCASLLVASGASIKAVQRWLGHSDIRQTLDVYAHLYVGELEAVSARLDSVMKARPAPSVGGLSLG